jgi:hypothetical protein
MKILGSPATHYIPAAIVWLFAAGFLVMTYPLPEAARSTPLLVGWVTLGLATIDLLSRTGGAFGEGLMRAVNPAGLKERQDTTPHDRRALISGLCLIGALVVSFIFLGVLPTTALIVFGALMSAYRTQIVMNAVIAAGATLGVWLLFSALLRLQLYPGLAFGGVL